jgi:hypothetical protein
MKSSFFVDSVFNNESHFHKITMRRTTLLTTSKNLSRRFSQIQKKFPENQFQIEGELQIGNKSIKDF